MRFYKNLYVSESMTKKKEKVIAKLNKKKYPLNTYVIALIEEGDIISINIPELRLEVKVSDEEMAARKAKWQPREPKVTTGYLARYAAMVTSGNRGAILEVPKAK